MEELLDLFGPDFIVETLEEAELEYFASRSFCEIPGKRKRQDRLFLFKQLKTLFAPISKPEAV